MYVRTHLPAVQPLMAMFNTASYAVGQDVNRVQNDFPTPIQGSEQQEASFLLEEYRRGRRLDWASLYGLISPDPFVGNRCWRMVDGNAPEFESSAL